MALITLAGIAKNYGGHEVLRDVDLQIDPRERVALVGANGAGKSTLLRIIAGRESPDAGEVPWWSSRPNRPRCRCWLWSIC